MIAEMTPYTKHRFHVLDGMRGVAAIVIMILHLNAETKAGLIAKFFANTFTAVDFFFVLSGFVVTHAYGDKLLGGMPAGDYIAQRVGRLFPMAALGLLVGVPSFYVFDVVGNTAHYSAANMVSSLLCNIFFLPYLGGDYSGSNFPIDGSLWSIFFEMVASVAFIWLVKLRSERLLWLGGVSYVGLVVASLWLAESGGLPQSNVGPLQINFWGGFPRVFASFICGMLLYRLYRTRPADGILGFIQKRRISSVPLLYVGLASILFFPFYVKGLYCFCVVMFAAPFWVIQGSQMQCQSKLMTRLSELLGWISYPLYCLHGPIMAGTKVLDTHFGLAAHMSLKAIAIPASLLAAAVSAFIFDRLNIQRKLTNGLKTLTAQRSEQ